MPANFRLDQPTGAGAGSSGAARDDLWVGRGIELHDVGSGMTTSREWILEDGPPGTSPVISNPTAAVATLNDANVFANSYRVTLRYDGVSDPNLGSIYVAKNKTFIFRVTKNSSGVVIPRQFPMPAAGELKAESQGIAGQGSTGRGHAPVLDALAAGVRELRGRPVFFPLVAGLQDTPSTSFTPVGGRLINPGAYPALSAVFRCCIWASPTFSVEARLFNVTDSVAIAATVLSHNTSTPTVKIANLSIPAEIPNSEKLFEVQYRIVGSPGVADRAYMMWAELWLQE